MSRAALAVLLAGCAHVPAPAGFSSKTIDVDGVPRRALVSAPAPGAALVLALHGRLGTPEGMAKLSGLAPSAGGPGLVVAFPEGVQRSWADARQATPSAKQGVDDVRFLAALIDALVQSHGVDPTQVFVLGMSNGGFMALTLACRLGDTLAGVASVTGSVSDALAADCAWPKPVPVALFLGDEDPLVPYGGGVVLGSRAGVQSADASARFFAQKNGCTGDAADEPLLDADPTDGTRITLRRWDACRAPVRLYTVRGGGHTWPGGWQYARERSVGRQSRDLDATAEALRFFGLGAAGRAR